MLSRNPSPPDPAGQAARGLGKAGAAAFPTFQAGAGHTKGFAGLSKAHGAGLLGTSGIFRAAEQEAERGAGWTGLGEAKEALVHTGCRGRRGWGSAAGAGRPLCESGSWN